MEPVFTNELRKAGIQGAFAGIKLRQLLLNLTDEFYKFENSVSRAMQNIGKFSCAATELDMKLLFTIKYPKKKRRGKKWKGYKK